MVEMNGITPLGTQLESKGRIGPILVQDDPKLLDNSGEASKYVLSGW